MDIKIYSANGPLISGFVNGDEVYSKFSEIGAVEVKPQGALAGPNDNFQIILTPVEVAVALGLAEIGKEIGRELLKLMVADFYESKKKVFATAKGYVSKLVQNILWATGIVPSGVSLMLGLELQLPNNPVLRDRNICFNLAGLSKSDIETRLFLLAVYGDSIKEFIKDISEQYNNGEKGGLTFVENTDCSVCISLDADTHPYVEHYLTKVVSGYYTQTYSRTTFRKIY
ncbi:hypothetical protein [Segetibacter aerophilus]|uniref:Uncharacterized protein n=1 Tax=Segetibacter aerophilus TaxID=670293 RepID=A0A512B9W3_9BACT|nr:hypothetical protein [Segetibacter aerophilus]GEO08756.1 hypothetical protein SAE01_12520 [Segetibacter aerophilus]